MEIIIYVLYSNSSNFKINHYYKINIQNKIGEGTYGYVYDINKDLVMKIFKYYTKLTENKDDNLLPNKNENRELNFFINYLQKNTKKSDYIININAIGIIKYVTDDKIDVENNYCLILPKCVSVMKLINNWKMPLIENRDGKRLVLNFMKRLIDIELFLNNNFNITNLDIKLNNYMIDKRHKININNILAIDFGLIMKNDNIKFNFDKKYYIWPKIDNININYISSYSICINGLILFLGESKVKKLTIKDNLKYLKDDNDFYNIFYNSLSLKIKCNELYNLINKYMKKNKFKLL